MPELYDAVVVGAGPNGLAAAVALAQNGARVVVLEGSPEIGGGTRTTELTKPGFYHDVCSAAHPLGILSPFLRTLSLDKHGLRWRLPEASFAHPLDAQPAVIHWPAVQATADELGTDGSAYRRLVTPFLHHPHGLLRDILGPLRLLPRHPWRMLQFGIKAIRSATSLANSVFSQERAKALFGGCAAHAIQPLEAPLTAALGLIFTITGHVEPWPVAEGGSQAIAGALASLLRTLGGEIRTHQPVARLHDLPDCRVALFDTSPAQLVSIADESLPQRYTRRLQRFRYGPGVFKMDWALREPIPWQDERVGKACTVHVGGTLDELAVAERDVWRGEHPEQPFVLVVQQSHFDPSRAPAGQHTGYAYCHVPAGSDVDLSDTVERQIERFAPGFRDCILARHAMRATDLEAYNPNYIGGAIAGGVADLRQLFTRPVARLDPYSTPNPRIFLCSASTPPGGGVHGMCGYYAAQSAWRRITQLRKKSVSARLERAAPRS